MHVFGLERRQDNLWVADFPPEWFTASVSFRNLHHCGVPLYNEVVQSQRKPAAKRNSRSVRQSVTIPANLAREVRRVAKERKVTMSRALVTLAEQGVEAQAAERARLAAAYEQFMNTSDPARKNEVGQELIQAIFGKAAIAEDPLR
jgi:hypothetical protein